jgi:hypothetical protein
MTQFTGVYCRPTQRMFTGQTEVMRQTRNPVVGTPVVSGIRSGMTNFQYLVDAGYRSNWQRLFLLYSTVTPWQLAKVPATPY